MNNYKIGNAGDAGNFVEDYDWQKAANDLKVNMVPDSSIGWNPYGEYATRLTNGKLLIITEYGNARLEPGDYLKGVYGEFIYP